MVYPFGRNSTVEGTAGGAGAVSAGSDHGSLRELQLRVVVAARSLAVAHNGVSATCDWRVAPRDPHAVDFDTTLNGTNAERYLVLCLRADSGDGLGLEHLGCLGLLAFVNLAVFAQLAAIVG